MILFGNSVFADIIKGRIEMRSCRLKVGPKCNECPYQAEKNVQKPQGEESKRIHMKTGAQMGAPARDCL